MTPGKMQTKIKKNILELYKNNNNKKNALGTNLYTFLPEPTSTASAESATS